MSFHKISAPVFVWHGPGEPVDPGYGQGSPGGRPDQDLPWGPGRPDNELPGGRPALPAQPLPPLPGIWPPPGQPNIPVVLPPLMPTNPIYIEGAPSQPGQPSQPIALPPGIYPPLPPDAGLPSGKVAILVWVVGVGYRWIVLERGAQPTPPIAPGAEPKK
jgi:hypothetical protein